MHFKHCGGLVGKLSWLLVSLSAINVGLAETGYFDFNNLGFLAHDHVRMILHYAVGIAGVLSLVGLFMHGYQCSVGEEGRGQHHGR